MCRALVAVAVVFYAGVAGCPESLAATGAVTPRTILLVDDHEVLYRSGTRRVLHPLTRSDSNPVIKADKPWEVLAGGASVYRNPKSGKYQMWYQAWSGDAARERSHRCVVAYAESDDGLHFSKPDLGLFNFNDIPNTNIVLVANGGHSDRYSNAVVVDPEESDPSKRYKMAYFDWVKVGGREHPGLCVAFSPDGIHWTKHPEGPLLKISYTDPGTPVPFNDERDRPWNLALTMSDVVDVIFDPQRRVFAFYGKMWIDGPDGGMSWKHAMGRSESKDFINWSPPQFVMASDDQDAPHVEFHSSPVFYYDGAYFSLNQILDRGTAGGVINIELMVSRDGLRWDRPFRNEWFLPRNPKPAFDSGSLYTNATPVVLEDEIRFYYGGYVGGATSGMENGSGVGLATLPRDRFAGVRPVARSEGGTLTKPLENVGQVTLKPADLSRYKRLTLNADAAQGGVWVEVLDDRGLRVRGFSRDDAVRITGDSVRHPVSWKDRTLADVAARDHILRIHLHNATLYALTLDAS